MTDKIFKSPKTRFALVFQPAIIALAGFIILRTIFLIRVWPDIDHSLSDWIYIFGQGLIYDMAFTGYFYIPFVILLILLPNKWINNLVFRLLAQGVEFCIFYGLCFNMVAEWIFWGEFGVRFNFISVDYLIYRREVTDNILQSYPVFWILPVLFIITVFIFFMIRPFFEKAMHIKENFSQRLVIGVCMLMIPGSAFIFLNQSQRSLSPNNYVNELASNGPYQLFAAFRNNSLDYRQFYKTGDDKKLSDLLKEQVKDKNETYLNNDLYNIARHIDVKKPLRKLNVILISVESLSAKYLTRFGEQRNITPFMDNWFKKGLLFTNFYATGTRTTRGLEAITLSIPPTPGRSIVKRPDNSHLYSLGKAFDDKGYESVFLYGGRGYFDNMNSFFSGNGYQIVDQNNFKDNEITFENAWGVSDEDLFNRTIKEANKIYNLKKPFFFHIMTTSNHQPFTYPEGRIDLPPGEGGTGSGRAGGVKYTDYALSRLIKKAKEQPWFDDTVFVILADHCAASAGKTGLPVKKYHIPLFIYAPKYILPEEINRLSSQMDVAPTILSLLHFSYDSFFFGRNILSKDFKERALIANYQKLGLLTDTGLLILSPRKEISFVDTTKKEPTLKKIDISYPFVKQLMAYYQGADYVFRHRLNRWTAGQKGLDIK